MTKALPDSYTRVMCDSASHDRFSSFDNTLVLGRGGNPCTSYGKRKRERERERMKDEEKKRQKTTCNM